MRLIKKILSCAAHTVCVPVMNLSDLFRKNIQMQIYASRREALATF